jgi:hypothetical protein
MAESNGESVRLFVPRLMPLLLPLLSTLIGTDVFNCLASISNCLDRSLRPLKHHLLAALWHFHGQEPVPPLLPSLFSLKSLHLNFDLLVTGGLVFDFEFAGKDWT